MMEPDESHWMLSRRDWDAIDGLRHQIERLKARSFEERIAFEAVVNGLGAILQRESFDYQVTLHWDGQDTRVDPDLEHPPNYAAVQIAVTPDQIYLSSHVYYDPHFRGEELDHAHIDLSLTADGSFPVREIESWLKAFGMRFGGPEITMRMPED